MRLFLPRGASAVPAIDRGTASDGATGDRANPNDDAADVGATAEAAAAGDAGCCCRKGCAARLDEKDDGPSSDEPDPSREECAAGLLGLALACSDEAAAAV